MRIKLLSVQKGFLLLWEITQSIHLMKSRIKLACCVITCEMETFSLYLKSYPCLEPWGFWLGRYSNADGKGRLLKTTGWRLLTRNRTLYFYWEIIYVSDKWVTQIYFPTVKNTYTVVMTCLPKLILSPAKWNLFKKYYRKLNASVSITRTYSWCKRPGFRVLLVIADL